MREQPLAVGAIGIAVGALIAASLPATATEDRYFGEARDNLVDKGRQKIRQGKEKMTAAERNVAKGPDADHHDYGKTDTDYPSPYTAPSTYSDNGRSPKLNS